MNKTIIVLVVIAHILLLVSWPMALGLEKFDLAISFMENIAATFIAAFVGVVGAQCVVENFQKRKEVIKELHSINTALMLSKISINALLNHKRVFSGFLKKYELDKNRISIQLDEGVKPNMALDIVSIKTPDMNLSELKEIIYTQIYAKKDVIFYASRLAISEKKMLEEVVEFNKIMIEISELATAGGGKISQAYRCYFNIKHGQHNVGDERLEGTFHAIPEVTDTALHHLCRLGEHLHARAQELIRGYSYSVPVVSFDREVFNSTGLMPDLESFESYEELF